MERGRLSAVTILTHDGAESRALATLTRIPYY